MVERGHSLVSQELREKILKEQIAVPYANLSRNETGDKKGWFTDESLEAKIQPSSFEPEIAGEVFVIKAGAGMFRPAAGKQVYRTLLELPRTQRDRFQIDNGYELRKGETLLVPLANRVQLEADERVVSSTKSSFGRVFGNVRFFGDYNPCFDKLSGQYSTDPLQLWLLIQSPVFNLIIHPGLTVNQLRYFTGDDAKMTASEIRELFTTRPFLYEKTKDQEQTPARLVMTDAPLLHLDGIGAHTDGVVALRARDTAQPLDTRKKAHYKIEDYFEPLLARDKPRIIRGEHYLAASKERLTIPTTVSTEVRRYSGVGITGPKDFAGFVDPNFGGDLVFEIRSDEQADTPLEHGMPICEMDFFRCSKTPDKVYGQGSHYQGQFGSKTSKIFEQTDFPTLAREHAKLERFVLVHDAKALTKYHLHEGFQPNNNPAALFETIEHGFFHQRRECEDDTLVIQPIPYVIIFGPNQTVFTYVRAKKIADYGEKKLMGKHSLGEGGHIAIEDLLKSQKQPSLDIITRGMNRELDEEVTFQAEHTTPKFQGTIWMPHTDNKVDRHHFGLIFTIYCDGNVEPKERALIKEGMIPIDQLTRLKPEENPYENWSKVLFPHLSWLYNATKP